MMALVRLVTAASQANGIKRQRVVAQIHDHRGSACRRHCQRRVRGGDCRHDHFVARPDGERPQEQGDRIGSIADGNSVGGTGCSGKLVFERFDLRAKNEPAASNDTLNRRLHIGRVLTRVQVVEWNRRSAHRTAVPSAAGT